MKKTLFTLLLLFFIPIFTFAAVDAATSMDVVFSYNKVGDIGFSTSRVISSSPVKTKINAEEGIKITTTSSDVNFYSDTIYIYWQIFTTTPVALYITEYPPLKKIDSDSTATEKINWKNNLKEIDIDSANQKGPIPVYEDEKPETEKISHPRIGSQQIQFTIPVEELNKIQGYASYSCTLTLKLEAI